MPVSKNRRNRKKIKTLNYETCSLKSAKRYVNRFKRRIFINHRSGKYMMSLVGAFARIKHLNGRV